MTIFVSGLNVCFCLEIFEGKNSNADSNFHEHAETIIVSDRAVSLQGQ